MRNNAHNIITEPKTSLSTSYMYVLKVVTFFITMHKLKSLLLKVVNTTFVAYFTSYN